MDAPNLPKEYFVPFTVGDVKKMDSAPDHRAPAFEDTIEGRYASALFIAASKEAKLYEVYEDIVYIGHLHKHCEHFRLFTENGGIGITGITALNKALSETAKFEDVTLKFLVVLAETKRLIYIREICKKYAKYY
jgi:F0F1-type ATP synthase delta subunit